NNDTDFAGIENLTGGGADDLFSLIGTGALSGVLDGGALDPATPSTNTFDLSGKGVAVIVQLEQGSAAELLTASGVANFKGINKVIGSASADDELVGPTALADQTLWNITGTNAGDVKGTQFSGFEVLTGQDDWSDAFVFGASGSLSGEIR